MRQRPSPVPGVFSTRTRGLRRAPRALRAALVGGAAVILLGGCTVIENGEVGVTKSFGQIRPEPLSQGIYVVLPIAREIESWNVKLRELKERAAVPSSEGLIVGLDTSLLFQVAPEQAPAIRTSVGQNYEEILVIPYLRNAVRDVVSGYEVKDIYSEQGRKQIAQRMEEYLRQNLEPRGIQVQAVLLRDVQLPERFRQSIEAKLAAEQKAEEKRFELQQAKTDAQIEVARAEGAAQAQKIIQSTLSERYLHYLWIQTLNENPNVVYVATEANLPVFKSVGGAGAQR